MKIVSREMAAASYSYTCHGMHIQSEFELPGLLLSDRVSGADRLTIQLGSFEDIEMLYSRSSEFSLTQYKNDCYKLTIPEIGGLSVHKNELVLYPLNPDRIQCLMAYVLGAGFAVALAMRGLCPMHASVVSRGQKTLAFGGPSGTGKSTAAAWLCRNAGASLIADDVVRLDIDTSEEAYFHRGVARVRLWADSLAACNISTVDATPEVWRRPKYSLCPKQGDHSVVDAGGMVIPTVHATKETKPILQELYGFEKIRALSASLYRPDLFALIAGEKSLHDFVVRAARSMRIYRFYFSKDFVDMESDYRFLTEQFLSESLRQLE